MCKYLNFYRLIIASCILALATISNAWADYEQGLALYNRGDYAAAFKEWQISAEQGDPKSQYELGLSYAHGEGVLKDDIEAVKWYRKAADQGLPAAQNNLGTMYSQGRGVPKNDDVAVEWYMRAAKQGSVPAMFSLALAYDEGRGIRQDYNIAAITYLEAAKYGFAAAQVNVGLLYAKNVPGVEQDYSLAYKWLSLAIPNLSGDMKERYIQSRDKIAAHLTPEERERMDQVVREWKPKSVSNNDKVGIEAPASAPPASTDTAH